MPKNQDGTRSNIWKSELEAEKYFKLVGNNPYGCKITGYEVIGTDGQPVSSEVKKLIYYDETDGYTEDNT